MTENSPKPDEVVSPLTERLARGALLATAVALLLWLALPMLLGMVYFIGDLSYYHLPVRHFYGACLHQGQNFAWFPNIFCGFYLHGEGQGGFYHPLHLLLYRCFPLTAAFNLELLLSYVVALAGFYVLLRKWELSSQAALAGAVIFAFAGYNLFHFVHINSVAVMAQIPWALLAVHVLMCDVPRRAALAAAGLSLLTASQILLGHPQSCWFSFLTTAAYVVLLRPRRSPHFRWRPLLTAYGLGVFAGGIQLLPTWEALQLSQRARAETGLLGQESLRPFDLLQFLLPFQDGPKGFNQQEFGLYNGTCVLVLTAWVLLRLKMLRAWRALAGGLFVFAALALVLAMGKYGGLYCLQRLLPVVSALRYPSRYVALFHLATAGLAALALADLFSLAREREPVPWRKSWPLAILPVASFLAAQVCLAGGGATAAALASPREIMLRLIILTLCTACVLLASRAFPFAAVAVALLLCGEVFWNVAASPQLRYAPLPAILAAQPLPPETPEAPDFRVRAGNWGNLITMNGVRLVNGLAGLAPARALSYRSLAEVEAASTRWVWGRYERKNEHNNAPDYVRVPHPVPRTYLVTEARATTNPAQDLEKIDLTTTALVPSGVDLGGAPGSAAIECDQPGLIQVRVSAPSRQLLVLTESYHPGWQATSEGRPREILKVNGDFMGCVVDAGDHLLEFRFAPASLRWGAWLSLAALALIALRLTIIFHHGDTEARRKNGEANN